MGADIVASTTFSVIPGYFFNYKWKRHGVEFCIPEDALDPDTPPLTVTIQASLCGKYQFPDNTELVSFIYWITLSENVSLKKPASLKLQHCAFIEHPEQIQSLSFITASHSQKTLPYNFKKLQGGIFSINKCMGVIELTHFCGLGVSRDLSNENENANKKFYVVHAYYIPHAVNQYEWHTDFVVVMNLEICLEVRFVLC